MTITNTLPNLRKFASPLAILLASITTWSATAQRQQKSSSINGRVVLEETGQAVSGSTLTLYGLKPPPAMGQWSPVEQVITKIDGSYSISGLATRQYRLCTTPPTASDDLVGDCSWGRQGRMVLVRGDQAHNGQDIAIERGRTIEVVVNDPLETLQKPDTRGSGVYLIVGVWGPDQIFRSARIAEQTKILRRYQVPIPFETEVKLEVKGKNIELADGLGILRSENAAAETVREQRSASKTPRRYVYTVRGVKR